MSEHIVRIHTDTELRIDPEGVIVYMFNDARGNTYAAVVDSEAYDHYKKQGYKATPMVPAMQPPPPTTELTDDAILELANKAFYPLDIGDSLNPDGILMRCIFAYTKALLSRKSESEAVAIGYVTGDAVEIMKVRGSTLMSPKRTELHDIAVFASPQPSDEKLRERVAELELQIKHMRFPNEC